MKRILTIIAVVLLSVLSVSVVSLAFIKTDFNQISLDNIEHIVLYNDGDMAIFEDTDNEDFKEIYNTVLDLYTKSTKEVVLSGLFGRAYTQEAAATISGPTGSLGSGGQMYMEIHYKTENLPTIMLDGKVYESPNGASNIKYAKARIMIDNTDRLSTVVTHLVLPRVGNESLQVYELRSLAKLNGLAEYLNELKEEGVWFK